MENITCGFIGLGLIGGSMAKALKNGNKDLRIVAYDVNMETLEMARADGIADEITSSIDEHFLACDYIFLCAPVQINIENTNKIKSFLKKDAILTDIGSVKTQIHDHIHSLGLDAQFIGGHPMAGTERIGYINSKPIILENAYYILTKTPETSDDKLNHFYDLVKSMGAIPLVMDHKQHDYIVAAISHVPHVISASLVNLVKNSDSENGLMKLTAAGGFKDITRISSSSPVMWQQICLTNTKNISELLGNYIDSLNKIKEQIDNGEGDSIIRFFNDARVYRESFIDSSGGPIKKAYNVHIDIADQPGVLATVATLLAVHNINIKNIGIMHNREYQSGSLQIEFNDEHDQLESIALLKSHGYIVS
ncbi:prephenate dehydrogenase [Butyrivibrio fibrisolvens DSM 3071]|uniref:Prephenate dehydrogenase n=1 Tax=Butyrivibrio fibrisolvens DSM 3071 TaxID=1121131 RepID=A0A1M5ZJR4_BUTFI|nr:prephenate dehydrogenase [Butyrivibrio fibrisolvens]SHI24404.1 prephenate dehydrogenase [Butyrivibrio fibrisolvens DSM 3071]